MGAHNTSIGRRALAITPRSDLSEDGTIFKEISYDHNESNVLPSFIFVMLAYYVV
jgi:hypothetical protein